MTIAMQESEARKWATTLGPNAPRQKGPAHPTLVLRTPGYVEIKPHTLTGIKSGLKQLGERLENAKPKLESGVLATYLGVDAGGNPVRTGRARSVRVYAVLVNRVPKPTLAQYGRPEQWHYLGVAPLPDTIDHPPVDHAPAFGWAVEPVVQRRVSLLVKLETPGRKWKSLGGPGRGPDMQYTELAEFYRELAHELRDPLYAELASELEAMADREVA